MIRNVFLILIRGNLLFITVEERVEFDGHLAAEGFPVKQIKINQLPNNSILYLPPSKHKFTKTCTIMVRTSSKNSDMNIIRV